MRVSIDSSRCQGTGFCAQLAPVLFAVGRTGEASRVLVETLPTALLPVAREAEALCPVGAITVVEQSDR